MEPIPIYRLKIEPVEWKKEYGPWTEFWNEDEYALCLAYKHAIKDAYINDYRRIILCMDESKLPTLPASTANTNEHLIFGPDYIIMDRKAYPAFLCFLKQPYGPVNIYCQLYRETFPCIQADAA